MSQIVFPYRLYLVTDEAACQGKSLLKIIEAAVKGGVDLVQLREKDLNTEAFKRKAIAIKELLDKYGVPLIINDNLEVAIASNASGIHVGNSDIGPVQIKNHWPHCNIIGYSLEFEKQLQNKETMAADYLALSPIFNTATKRNTVTEWGLEGTQRIRSLTSKPLVAIGNINATNAGDIITAGADCLAVVAAICSAPDPAKAAETLRNIIEKNIRMNVE